MTSTLPAKILVVDDVPANLSVLLDALAGAGHRVLVAESGESALQLLPNVVPNLVLLDVRLPGIDGFETCARLKRDERWRELPVIFLTSLDDAAEKVRAFAAGAVDYVTKPIEPAEVVARVGAHLRLRALQAELAEKNIALATEVAERRDAEERLRHSLDRAVIVADSSGRITFATKLAEHLLRKYFSDAAPGVLPDALKALLIPASPADVTVEIGARRLSAQLFTSPAGGPQRCLLLEEARPEPTPAALVTLGLTLREAEVLYWVTEGKSSPEIALLLSCSPRTVEKHLGNIYPKLGVENRASAMRTALGVLENNASA
jgi:DNA-binding response OmpR family regulator/DNA-binding CsgD family transcriptional regulator